MTTNEQAWQETDLDHAEADYTEWGKGKTRTVKPPPGRSVWWIMPARKGAKQGATPFKRGTYIHFVRDPRNPENMLAVGICPSKTRNEPCAVCPFLSKMRKTGNAADIDLADQMSAKEFILANVVNLEPKGAYSVEIMQIMIDPYKILNDILKDRKTGVDFTHPLKGYPVVFEKKGSSKNDTEYSARLAPRQSPLPDMKLLEQMHDLDTVFEEMNHQSLALTLAGNAPPARQPGEAVEGAADQKQIAGAPADTKPGAIEMVQDPLTGEMVPASSLRRSR
jgi:gp32-like DNA binding protein